ncbi:MAG: hypothetical protein MUE41_10130 [Gemmatimonadaceae bacterium]|nr:hypothetical protein [Gemmatimonadaceae bacterium]
MLRASVSAVAIICRTSVSPRTVAARSPEKKRSVVASKARLIAARRGPAGKSAAA